MRSVSFALRASPTFALLDRSIKNVIFLPPAHDSFYAPQFVSILESRARSAEVLPASLMSDAQSDDVLDVVNNPYYDVLYAFHVQRLNYRGAAACMFEHAHRLDEEEASLRERSVAGGARLLVGLQRQAVCLLTAINALYLLPAEHRWLVRPTSGVDLQWQALPANRMETLQDVSSCFAGC